MSHDIKRIRVVIERDDTIDTHDVFDRNAFTHDTRHDDVHDRVRVERHATQHMCERVRSIIDIACDEHTLHDDYDDVRNDVESYMQTIMFEYAYDVRATFIAIAYDDDVHDDIDDDARDTSTQRINDMCEHMFDDRMMQRVVDRMTRRVIDAIERRERDACDRIMHA